MSDSAARPELAPARAPGGIGFPKRAPTSRFPSPDFLSVRLWPGLWSFLWPDLGTTSARIALAITAVIWFGIAIGAVLVELHVSLVSLALLFAVIALAMAAWPSQTPLARARRALRKAHQRHDMLLGMGYEDFRREAWDDYIAARNDLARLEAEQRRRGGTPQNKP